MPPKKPAKKTPAKKKSATKAAPAKKSAGKSAPAKRSATKAAKKTAPKAAKKPAAKKKAALPRAATVLSSEERRTKLKPRENYAELVAQLVRALKNNPRVRIDGVRASTLEQLLKKAEKASAKEAVVRDAVARKLQPAVDTRLVAEDALWRAVLDVNAGVKPYARKDGTIADAFGFLATALTGERREPSDDDEPADDEEPKDEPSAPG